MHHKSVVLFSSSRHIRVISFQMDRVRHHTWGQWRPSTCHPRTIHLCSTHLWTRFAPSSTWTSSAWCRRSCPSNPLPSPSKKRTTKLVHTSEHFRLCIGLKIHFLCMLCLCCVYVCCCVYECCEFLYGVHIIRIPLYEASDQCPVIFPESSSLADILNVYCWLSSRFPID